ncbi:PREDICTED: histone H2A.Z-specific chaperone CHZ1-like isoform X3 [Tarenaya hassleriana]|uniref:histone H2A.Z-specific chaperone CHZ1-like isoform X1 n=1 Tax=Tarenaya hassleriana TaxID=28532 RepID=UPI00053C3DF7|nr:PREDICTED: histone H2A.Z-specific chaperone CHZ1-like isoform X1 [Tarenaya hassleriana]XP_010556319.1 PREDICTED: histone H2A.Z-specific chaperone CHZ1-like isoform X2 [Tarenaya hassleriana]XP_010556320.1 PREDICTED: histone H2A.Z-specific chaperone CHZ1-like isoform X3 [Tarenaya hassleriana]XP_010556321.1 PREDICTED: histone H2A.Z-specific chaperone CHZ1-like isoform X3 [Tarenaya hassleriana]
MADVENQQEPPLPVKRKADLYCQDQDNAANKAQKLQPSNSTASESKDEGNCGNLDSAKEKAEIEPELVISPEKAAMPAAERDEICGGGGYLEGEEEQEEENGEEEEARREAEVDRKGKGIMRDYKGKGKLIEDDDSDENDEEGDDEDADSDLSDDPLAEVDLDNILPSRTRRRAMQPGLYISGEIANHDDNDDDDDDDDDDEDDEDDDDSEDSEA